LKSNLFSWDHFRQAFQWSNTRAYFSGSMVEREKAEMLAVRERVHGLWRQSPQAAPDYDVRLVEGVFAEATRRAKLTPIEPLAMALKELTWQLLQEDKIFYGMPEIDEFDHLDIDRAVALRTLLAGKEKILGRFSHYEDLWRATAIKLVGGVLHYLPPTAFDDDAVGDSAFTIKVIDICDTPGELIERITGTVATEEMGQAGLFSETGLQLERNAADTIGMTREKAIELGRRPVYASDATGKTPRELVETYLAGTPFFDLFATDLPFAIPEASRFEHMHILAGSGHGKTQTLQSLILRDLQADDPPGMVVIDSQGDLINNISRLAPFEWQEDRLIIIDPRDVEHPPALNMFDVNLERINRYGAADREQILNGVVELYEYFFGSLLGAELTQKQSLVFRYLARLMIQIPGATLRTMIELMDDLKPYSHIIAKLPDSSRMFFEREFSDRQFGETRTQVKRRLYGIIENQTFERMFSAPRNRIDLGTALNDGKIILINTARDFLKSNSSILGRYFIALTLQAALERAAISEKRRHPSFLYIDEASEYFDDNIDNLLIQARKYRLGLVIAHQYLDQLQGGLRASIAANTSIKFAGGVSDRDARAMAPDMRTTPSFLMAQQKGQHATQFAAFIRNVTPAAISLAVPFGLMEAEERMDGGAYAELIERNREKVSGPRDNTAPSGIIDAETQVVLNQAPSALSPDYPEPRAGDGSRMSKTVAAKQYRDSSERDGSKRGEASAGGTDASPEW